MHDKFSRFARTCAEAVGSPWAFAVAVAITLVWVACGPFFGFSDTWQLVYNTITTCSTGLLVFLIQHTQNADTDELKALIRELVRAVPQADNDVIQDAQEEGTEA